MKLDNVDKEIINALILDSKSSYRDIAKKVKVSVATAMNRTKRLEKEGIIKRYTTIIDYDKIGFDVEVMIEIRISKGKLFNVEKEIAHHPNVFGVYDERYDHPDSTYWEKNGQTGGFSLINRPPPPMKGGFFICY